MIRCDEIAQMTCDYADGSLPLGKRISVRLHLMVCAPCRALSRSMSSTLGVLRALREAPIEVPVTEAKGGPQSRDDGA